MAWPVWRTTKGGGRSAKIYYRDPATKRPRYARTLVDPTDLLVAAECAKAARDLEGRLDTVRGRSDVGRALRTYLEWLRLHPSPITGRPRSAKTIAFYHLILGELFKWLGERAPISRWRPELVEDCIAAHPKWKPARVRSTLREARRFIRWAARRYKGVPDFVGEVRGPRVIVTEPEHYKALELAKILAAAKWRRHEIAIALAAFGGLYPSDLVELTRDQVDLVAGVITGRRAKTGHPYTIPIMAPLREVLERRMPEHGRLCPDLPRRPQNARRALRKILEDSGLLDDPKAKWGWRKLRHSYGSTLGHAGATEAEIRSAMGHAPQSPMPRRYTHAERDRVVAVGQRAAKVYADAVAAARGKAKRKRA